MKLNLPQLKTHLNSKLMPIYLVSSDELFLKQTAIKQIKKSAHSNEYTEHVRLVVEASLDWNDVYQRLVSPSLFNDKQVIELDMRQSLPGKAGSTILEQYAKNINPDVLLILNLPKADAKLIKCVWFKALEKLAAHLVIWPVPREQLPQWIRQRASIYKMTLSDDAARLLADYTEGSLSAAAQAVEKLFLLQPTDKTDVECIQQIISDQGQFTIFDFTEACMAADQKRAMRILSQLKAEGCEPTLLLWSVSREIRLLADMSIAQTQQQSFESLCKTHRVFAKRQQSLRRFLSKNNYADCQSLLTHAAEIDRMIKGISPGNIWNQFEIFCLRIK